MVIIKYVVAIFLSFVVESIGSLGCICDGMRVIDRFVEATEGEGTYVGLINDDVWMIERFVGETGYKLVGRMIGELEGTEVSETNGDMVGLPVWFMVVNSLHLVWNVVDIVIVFVLV